MFQHEQEEVTDHHGHNYAVAVDLKLVAGHLGELHVLIRLLFFLFFFGCGSIFAFVLGRIVQESIAVGKDF